MTRILKYIGILLAIITGLLIFAVVVINVIPGDKYKDLISSGVKSATGRDLKFEGELDIKLFPTFAFKSSGIKFANADWGSKPHMASIGAIEAEIGLFPLLKGILDVTLLVDEPDLHLETHSSGQGNWKFFELAEEAAKSVEQIEKSVEEVQSEGGFPLRLRIRKVVINETRITYIDGKSGDRIPIEKKKLIIEPVDGKLAVDLEAKFNDIPLSLSGDFGNAELFMDNQPTSISLAGNVGDIKLAVQGTIGPMTPTFDLNVNIKLNADNVAAVSPLAGQELPDIGPLAISAAIIGKDGQYSVNDLLATLDDKIITAEVKASIADLVAMRGLKFEAEVNTDQLAKTCEIFGLKLKSTSSDSSKSEVVPEDTSEELIVEEFDTTIKEQESNVNGTKQVTRAITIKGVPSELVTDADSLRQIVQDAKTEQPITGSLNNEPKTISKVVQPGIKESHTDLSSGDIQVKVSASVADVLKLSGIDAGIILSVDSLTSLNDFAKQELPASGPVTLEGKIVSKGSLKSPVRIDTVLKSDGFMASVTGSIVEPLAVKGIDLALDVEAESMLHVGKLTGAEFVSTDPMKLVGKLTSNTNSYELAGLNLQIGQNNLKGKVSYQHPTNSVDRPRVIADLHVSELDFSVSQKARLEAAEETVENEKTEVTEDDEDKKKKIFPSHPLPWKPLRAIDVDIEITVETLKTLQLNLEKMVANIGLDNGLLTLKPVQAKVGEGSFGGTVIVDARNSPASLVADMQLSDATLRDFGGKVNFFVDLEGRGNSVAEIMAGLNGQLQVDVRDATLKKSLMTGFGSNLFSSLNPFDKDEENTELICAIILFDIKNGIADANKTIAAQMTDVTWFGSGEINLITEEIDFGISPKARKGLGISLGGLAKMVQLGGTLAHPKVAFDPKDMAVMGGKYSAAVATGGLTVLADMLFSKIKANTDVCTSILEELDEIQEAEKNNEMSTEEE